MQIEMQLLGTSTFYDIYLKGEIIEKNMVWAIHIQDGPKVILMNMVVTKSTVTDKPW